MSASREKRQRQAGGHALTQKELQQQKEAQATRKRTILYAAIAVVVVVLVAALLVWNSGIFQRGAAAATVGDRTFSAAEMQYYYGMVRQNEIQQQQMYSQYGISVLSEPYLAYDTEDSLGDKQLYNTQTMQTYADHFKESALDYAKSTAVLVGAAKAEGYTLSSSGREDVNTSISSLKDQVKAGGFPSFASYLNQAYGSYVTEKVFTNAQMESKLASEYYTHHQNSLEYTDDQLNTYSKENPANVFSYDYQLAYISGAPEAKTDASGNTIEATEEEKTAAKQEAEEKADHMVDALNAETGDKTAAFHTLAADALGSDSTYAKAEGNLHEGVQGSTLSSTSYYSWLTSTDRQEGDATAIASGDNYYVLHFIKRYLNNDPTVQVRHILIRAELPEDDPATAEVDESKAPTQEAMDAAKTEAQRILDEFNAGDKTAESFGKLAEKYSSDTSSAANGGLIRYITAEDSYVQSFEDWALDPERKVGDAALVENNVTGNSYFGWHVMYFEGADGPKWHSTAVNALRSTDMETWSTALEDAAPAAYVAGQGPEIPTPTETPSPAPTDSASPAPTTTPEQK